MTTSSDSFDSRSDESSRVEANSFSSRRFVEFVLRSSLLALLIVAFTDIGACVNRGSGASANDTNAPTDI
jgi:hypothetical protein